MIGVLEGFSIVWLIILVGYFIGRMDVLGPNAQQVLSRLAFFVASPALLLQTVSRADLATVLSTPLLVAAGSAVATAAVCFAALRFWLRRGATESVMGAMSGSVVNAANLGLPVAVYVLGDGAYVAPVLIFQLAFFTPMYLMVMDSLTSGHRTTVVNFLVQILRNPMIIGTGLGLLLAATRWRLPDVILSPVTLIGGAAVPAMLLAFGISLVGSRPLQQASGRRADVLLASAAKLVLQPVLALLLGRLVLGMDGQLLFAVVVCAALPTAQNVFVAANRYRHGVVVAKDTVLITTVMAIPALLGVAALLA